MQKEIAYFNGAYFPVEQISIHPYDRGFLLGDGFFDTLLVIKGKAVLLQAHWNRLTQTALKLAIDLPIRLDEFAALINELIHRNDLLDSRASVRITISRGIGARGIQIVGNNKPTFLITAKKLSLSTAKKSLQIGQSGAVNEFSPTAGLKTLAYLNAILAKKSATDNNYADQILLNTKGNIVSSTVANIFLVKDSALFTPSLQEGCLAGITRQLILTLCMQQKIPCYECPIPPQDLFDADEIFLTNSLYLLQSIAKIHNHRLEITNRGVLFNVLNDLVLQTVEA